MKNFIAVLLLVFCAVGSAKAIVIFDEYVNQNKEEIFVTGFYNYPPIGWFEGKKYETIFNPLLNIVSQRANLEFKPLIKKSYADNLKSLERKQSDIILGCFKDTKIYNNLEPVVPAVFVSPISIITLPKTKIAQITQLKNLKAGVSKDEYFSDFIKKQIKTHNAQEFDNYEQMLKALFNKEIDYIFSNYYFGTIEVSNLGLSNLVVFSKQSLWNMPVFICINKDSPKYQKLFDFFSTYSKSADVEQETKELLIKTINDIKLKNRGVTVPSYIVEQK